MMKTCGSCMEDYPDQEIIKGFCNGCLDGSKQGDEISVDELIKALEKVADANTFSNSYEELLRIRKIARNVLDKFKKL